MARTKEAQTFFTPGPWRRDEKPKGHYAEQVLATSPRGKEICVARIGSGPERREADARLIAAAPELLAALEALVYLKGETGMTYEDAYHAMFKGAGRDAWQAAEAAIAKCGIANSNQTKGD